MMDDNAPRSWPAGETVRERLERCRLYLRLHDMTTEHEHRLIGERITKRIAHETEIREEAREVGRG